MKDEIDFEIDVDKNQAMEEPETLNVKQREIFSYPLDEEVELLYNQYRVKQRLILQPNFQRHYVWDPQTATSLIESALLGIPLPVIYFAEEEGGKKSVIDGQQRLTTFFSFIDGKFPNGSEFRLRKMRVFPELSGKTYAELDSDSQEKIQGCRLHTITFKANSDPELKFDVFERLNTGAVSLNTQELRNCIYRGPFNDFLKELANDPDFKFILGVEKSAKRMLDVELVLRFFAFYEKGYNKYKSPIKTFLNEEMRENQNISQKKIEELKAAFKKAVSLVKSMRGGKAFRRFYGGDQEKPDGSWEPQKFNYSLYDILMVCFADCDDKNLVMRNLDAINEAYIDLLANDKKFCDSIEISTSTQQAVKTRFEIWSKTLGKILSEDSKQPRCFTKEFKERLFNSNPTCAICGQEIKDVDDAAVDHIEQYWQGGKTIPENARLVHRYCNCHRARKD